MIPAPAVWTRSTFKDLGTWYGGGTPSKAMHEFWKSGSIPWLSPKDMGPDVLASTKDVITEAAVARSSAKLVPKGSVAVVVRSGILERTLPVAYVPFATTLNQDMKAVVPRPGIDPRWIAWGFRAQERQLLRDCRKAGTTVASIEMPRFLLQTLPVPPLDEQRLIVEILEDHLSRLDAANDNLDRVAASLLPLRLTSLRGERERVINGGASLTVIGELSRTSLGKMLDAKKASGSPTPYLRNINVRWGFVDLGDVLTVPLSDQERQKLALQDGDLLVCEGGEPGRCAVWRHQGTGLMTYQKALHRIRVDSSAIDVDFLALMLEEFIRTGRANAMFTGTTIKHLPQERLRTIPIPMPSREDQKLVVTRIDGVTAESAQLRREVRRARSRSNALQRALLQAAFSGRLTGSSTDSEIIEELADV